MAIIDPSFPVACALLLPFALHLVLRRFFRKPAASTRLPLPPGPSGIPILGSLPLVGSTRPHSSLARLDRQALWPHHVPQDGHLRRRSGLLPLRRPHLPQKLRRAVRQPPRRHQREGSEVTYGRQNMVFSDHNTKWKLLRKLTSFHLLGAKALANWEPVRRAEAAHMVRGMLGAARRGQQPITVPNVLVCAFANIIN